MGTLSDPLVQVVSYHGSESGVWLRQSKSLTRIKPYCQKHNRMGEWKPKPVYEDLGEGVMSLVDSVDLIVCEACE